MNCFSSSLKHIAVMGIVWSLRFANYSFKVRASSIDTCPSEVSTPIWPIFDAFIPALGLWWTSLVMAGLQLYVFYVLVYSHLIMKVGICGMTARV